MECHQVTLADRDAGCVFPGQSYNFGECPREDSNLRSRLRKPMLYPLSYGGQVLESLALDGVGATALCRTCVPSSEPHRRERQRR